MNNRITHDLIVAKVFSFLSEGVFHNKYSVFIIQKNILCPNFKNEMNTFMFGVIII
jgi:hypothetical protein